MVYDELIAFIAASEVHACLNRDFKYDVFAVFMSSVMFFYEVCGLTLAVVLQDAL